MANDLSLSEPMKKKPHIGEVVLAPHFKEKGMLPEYYRGLVESILNQRNDIIVRLLFVDIGYTTDIRFIDLRQFKDKALLNNIPGLAFECVLTNIKPSLRRNISSEWSKEACVAFDKLLRKVSNLYGEIYSVVNGVVSLSLLCDMGSENGKKSSEKLHVDQFLVEQGHAEYRAEGYLSEQNHDVRKRHHELTPSQRHYFEESQYESDHLAQIHYPESPRESECNDAVYLKGPFSPLKIELQNLCTVGASKKALVDSTSVNAVLLDVNPEESESSLLLVAASVTQNPKGDKLCLRNTTRMPNARGLTSLLALIFAPRIELKRNNLGNRYVGALCGLGFHPITKASLFPEHDMPITFDVDITNDDLCDVSLFSFMH